MIPFAVWSGAIAALALGVSLAVSGAAQTLCLTLAEPRKQVVYPVAFGEKLTLSFAHSIYGAQIQEQFRIIERGFESVKLRYAQLRLVEFYGHESATWDNGWWVVANPGRQISSLEVSVSQDAAMRISIAGGGITLPTDQASHGRARLSVAPCP
jgi:hypothetical protein